GSRPPQPPARSSPARSLHDALPISGLRRPGYAKVAAISRPAVRMSPSRSALIVDDERDIRELLALTLGRMGLRVDTAVDVASATDRKSTRLNSSHVQSSYAVFCLKK